MLSRLFSDVLAGLTKTTCQVCLRGETGHITTGNTTFVARALCQTCLQRLTSRRFSGVFSFDMSRFSISVFIKLLFTLGQKCGVL